MTRAGTPATILRGGTELMTTALAPTTEPEPISISPSTLAPVAISTLSPIRGRFGLPLLPNRNLLADKNIVPDFRFGVDDDAEAPIGEFKALPSLDAVRYVAVE